MQPRFSLCFFAGCLLYGIEKMCCKPNGSQEIGSRVISAIASNQESVISSYSLISVPYPPGHGAR